MGCLLGGYLGRAGNEVFLLDSLPERVEPIEATGILVEGVGGDFQAKARAGTAFEGPAPDAVLLCVKSYDTERAARSLPALLSPSSLVLTLQNGVGNIEQLARHVPRDQLLVGTTSIGANLLRPGHVHHAGEGETHVGDLSGESLEPAQRLARLLTEAKLPTSATADIGALIWSKLAVNVGINALTAILRVRNGRLLSLESAASVMESAVRECLDVAEASGVELDREAASRRVREVARLTASNRSSMLMDVLGERRTEIDAMNGAVVRRGRELGLPVPVNETLTALVRCLEESYGVQER
jgi:2-dehydropantoate 2-reductase